MNVTIKSAGKKGRGVFAAKRIRQGATIEVCPMIIVPHPEWNKIAKTKMADYVFGWGAKGVGLALGYGSLYNHSVKPNAEAVTGDKRFTLKYVAQRNIKKGEEITINYGYTPEGYFED